MRSSVLVFACCLIACGRERQPQGEACESAATSWLDPASLLCVEIDLPEEDFEELAAQQRFGRSNADLFPGAVGHVVSSCTEPFPDPYTWFPADLRVNGEALQQIAVRKKGFVGSVIDSSERPSLKVDTDRYVEQSLTLDSRMTLNNNRSDATRLRTCLTYSIFHDAGYPAPLCQFANVMLNGTSLGVYTHIEPMKKGMLRRLFGNDDGSLYEATVADFTPDHLARLPQELGRWEAKTGSTDRSGAPLQRVRDALEVADEDLPASLARVLDLDALITFLALEALLAHQDGYAANTNNAYIYFDEDDGRGTFLPWGPDDAMFDEVFHPGTSGQVAQRVMLHPELRSRFDAEVRRLMEEVWDEARLTDRIRRWSALAAEVEPSHDGTGVIGWIEGRRAAVEVWLAEPTEIDPLEPNCLLGIQPEEFTTFGDLGAIAAHSCRTAPVRFWRLHRR